MVQREKYTAEDVDELDSLEEFDEAEGDLDDDLDDDDLDDDLPPELDDDDLAVDLDPDLDSGIEGDLDHAALGGLSEVGDDGVAEDGVVHEDVEDVEDEDEEATVEDDEDDEDGEEALDVLLAREEGLDDDLHVEDEPREGLSPADAPVGAGEFTCRSCFLVKRRPQLADNQKMICFDCL